MIRRSVLGTSGTGTIGREQDIRYDENVVHERCALIGYAIDARSRHRPDEEPFVYMPHADAGETYVWNDAARERIRGYNKWDLFV